MRVFIFSILLISAAFLFAEEMYLEVPETAESVPVPEFIDLNKADFSKAPDQHIVVRGDTLWDLSSNYLKSPWYWPKVWSINPQIANPHLIYPGNPVYFKGTGEMIIPSADDGDFSDEYARTGRSIVRTPDSFKEYVQLGGNFRITKFKNEEFLLMDITRNAFISNEKMKESGVVFGSFLQKELLATGDMVYVKLDNFETNIGNFVQFYRKEKSVTHPVTEKNVGSMVVILGKGRVLDINTKGIAKVKIIKSFREILRKDRVRSWEEEVTGNINITKPDGDIKATILTSYDPISEYGTGNLVFIDKGADSGLKRGDMLTVKLRRDGLNSISDEEIDKIPYEPIGELVLVKTEKTTSTAYITKSLFSIKRGFIATSEN